MAVVNILVLIALCIGMVVSGALCGLAWRTLGLWTRPAEATRFTVIWLAITVAFFTVLYNPQLFPDLLRAIPLPPSPTEVN